MLRGLLLETLLFTKKRVDLLLQRGDPLGIVALEDTLRRDGL